MLNPVPGPRQTIATQCKDSGKLVGRYIGIQEKEFEWLTEQLVSLANKCCDGRIVSALEGGYRIQGGVVSAFARSVAAHVRALSASNKAEWRWEETKAEQQRERQRRVCLMPQHAAALALPQSCICLFHFACQLSSCLLFVVSGACVNYSSCDGKLSTGCHKCKLANRVLKSLAEAQHRVLLLLIVP